MNAQERSYRLHKFQTELATRDAVAWIKYTDKRLSKLHVKHSSLEVCVGPWVASVQVWKIYYTKLVEIFEAHYRGLGYGVSANAEYVVTLSWLNA